MRKRNEYEDFQDRIFQQLKDMESLRNERILVEAAEAYGFTLDEVLQLCKAGMNGRQLLEAIQAARKK